MPAREHPRRVANALQIARDLEREYGHRIHHGARARKDRPGLRTTQERRDLSVPNERKRRLERAQTIPANQRRGDVSGAFDQIPEGGQGVR